MADATYATRTYSVQGNLRCWNFTGVTGSAGAGNTVTVGCRNVLSVTWEAGTIDAYSLHPGEPADGMTTILMEGGSITDGTVEITGR